MPWNELSGNTGDELMTGNTGLRTIIKCTYLRMYVRQ